MLFFKAWSLCPADNYMFKVNRNVKTRYEICSELTIKTPDRRRWCCRTYFTPCSSVSIVNFEQVNAGWVLGSNLQMSCFAFASKCPNPLQPRKMCEICSKSTLKKLERRHWRFAGAFIVNFDQISYFPGVSIVEFEQINVGWFVLENAENLQSFYHKLLPFNRCLLL